MRMNTGTHLIAVLAATLFVATTANAHIATERYIPIGMSPGISGKHSYIGEIEDAPEMMAEAASTDLHTMHIDRADGGDAVVYMNKYTRIYVDRTKAGKTNLRGDYSDCRSGRRVEVKFRDNDPSQPAEWVKVEVTR